VTIVGETHAGRWSVELELANYDDLVAARRGELKPEEVRRLKIDAAVNRRISRLVLPEAAVKKLELWTTGKVNVVHANGRSAIRPTVEVYLDLMGRHGTYTAVVDPERETALIGSIVLDDLDLLVDGDNWRVYPRHPDYILSEA
jgi:hypothetical protein